MSLRGSHDDGGSYHASSDLLSSAIRLLQVAIDDAPADADNEKPSEEEDPNNVIWFVVAAAAVVLCYGYCLVAVVRQWWSRSQEEVPAAEGGSVLFHEGMVFNLDPAQRRAVLEIIFSESSQVSVFYNVLFAWFTLLF